MDVLDGDYLDYIDADDEWEELLWLWQRTQAPKGCRVELVEGIVTVTPLARVSHQVVAARVHRRLCAAGPAWGVHQWWPVAVPSRLGIYLPDITVVPEEQHHGAEEGCLPATEAALVVEIASRATARVDRTVKARAYAEAGVPLYLLLDGLAPGGPRGTLHGAPEKGAYRVLSSVAFGEPVELPAPFDLVIDTAEFPEA
ncbi:Uma2 family endonuclease [Streptomyces sp. NPDC096105]|uniref:Uma2 family endonuclease n=1 Tax=Streptomyces sp. NPDC096105 TaxID=3366074 RepID=UPI003804D680